MRSGHAICRTLITMLRTVVILAGLLGMGAQGGAQDRLEGQGAMPQVIITAPQHGAFSTASSLTITGQIMPPNLSGAQVTLNGAPVTLNPDGAFAADIALDAGIIFNPILAELTVAETLAPARARIVVIAGDSIGPAALAPESLGLRLNDSGIDRVEPLIASLVDVDLASLLPPGSLFSDDVCTEIPPFGTQVCGEVEVSISPSRPPRFGSFKVNLDSQADAVTATLDVTDILVSADVEASAGPVSISCQIDISAGTMQVMGAYSLEPKASDPASIDVTQLGNMTVTFGTFNDDTDCGGLLGDVIEGLADLFIGDVQNRLRSGLEDFLNTVDRAGNTPIAQALEDGLADVALESVINELATDPGLMVEAPLARVAEDATGITLNANTLITAVMGMQPGQCDAPPGTPMLPDSYQVPGTFPVFGPTTPMPSTLPYDVSATISVTGFNQLLKAVVECGLLHMDVAEVDVGFGPVPITAGLLSLFIPAFQNLEPDLPLTVTLRPSLAPLITGNPGPAGELVDLRVSHFLVEIVDPVASALFLRVALDVRVGFNLADDAATGTLQPSIGEVAELTLEILDNAVGTDLPSLQRLVDEFLPMLSDLNDAVEPLPLPSFLDIPLTAVEIVRQDGYLSLFMNLEPPF